MKVGKKVQRLYGVFILLSLIWGSSFFFIKILLAHYAPASIAFLRCFFGLVTITIIMLVLRKPFHLRQIPWKPMVMVGLLQTAVPWYLLGYSETRITSSMASVLNATTPFWTTMIGFWWFHKQIHRNQWIGLFLGVCGIFILLDFHPKQFITVDFIGVLLMLATTFCYGYSSQVSKRDLGELSIYQTVWGTMFVGCLSSGIIALCFEPFTFAPLLKQPNVIFSFVMLGSMGSAVGFLLFFYMVQKGSAEFSTMVTYLVPATAILWGFLLLDEPIRWTLLAGLCLILIGVFLSERKPKEANEMVELEEKSNV